MLSRFLINAPEMDDVGPLLKLAPLTQTPAQNLAGMSERTFDDTDAESIGVTLQPGKATQFTVTLMVRGERAAFIFHSDGFVFNLDGELGADVETIMALGGKLSLFLDDDLPVLEINSPDKYRFMKMGPFPIPRLEMPLELIITRFPCPRGPSGDVHLARVEVAFDA
jgi:hypothetical protein